MAAKTGILVESHSSCHELDVMPEHTAEVSHFLVEERNIGIRITILCEQQRMTALHADVLVIAVSVGEPLIRVMPQET